MWPYTIERARNGYKVYQIFASKVEVNAELPTDIFDSPQRRANPQKSELIQFELK